MFLPSRHLRMLQPTKRVCCKCLYQTLEASSFKSQNNLQNKLNSLHSSIRNKQFTYKIHTSSSIATSTSDLFTSQTKAISKNTVTESVRTITTATFEKSIFAVSSGHGKCGVAVIRVSGPKSSSVVTQMTKLSDVPEPRMAKLCRFHHPQTGDAIDHGLLLWFPGPHSFTGEDCVEMQTHGGPAVIAAMLDALTSMGGLRHAEPGDFTKRAFQNGKMDLVEVEGLGDLIHAETEAQRKQALRQMEGDLSQLYQGWRQGILKCVANSEAYIDFSEEDNIEDGIMEQVDTSVEGIVSEMERHLSDNRCGERLRSGVHVAIVGEPNVGKSSILNILCLRPAAIVSPIAGTTRDVVETAVNLGGYPVLLSDTAGLREAQDLVEREGVRRALHRGMAADLKILVLDAQTLDMATIQEKSNFVEFVKYHLRELGFSTITDDINADPLNSNMSVQDNVSINDMIVVINKTDLLSNTDNQNLGQFLARSGLVDGIREELAVCGLSCTSGEGLDYFTTVLTEQVKHLCSSPGVGSPSLTQARHRSHLTAAVHALRAYQLIHSQDLVLAVQELRMALRHIGKITGQVSSEEILDVIFRDFCIGK